MVRVPLAQIFDNPYQRRVHYESTGIARLAANIQSMKADSPATCGLQQIPMARAGRVIDGEFDSLARAELADIDQVREGIAAGDIAVQLCFGHRRNRVFRLLAQGWEAIDPDFAELTPGFETDADYAAMPLLLTFALDMDMWRHVVSENHHRSDISAVEQALTLKDAIDQFALSHAEIGDTYGWTRSTVANKLRLLDLPEAAQQAIQKGELSEKHGRLLLRLAPAPGLLEQAMQALMARDMSTRELSEFNEKLIANSPLLPDGTIDVPDRYRADLTVTIEPPFDYDWFPGPGEMDEEAVPHIVGTCNTCPHRVKFAGDKAHRCAAPREGVVLPGCYRWKKELWGKKQKRDQSTAARMGIAEPAQAATGLPVSRETPVDADRNTWETAFFCTDASEYSRDAMAELVDRGLCGTDQCECFGVYYCDSPDEEYLRPDPDNAPNMCCGCTSSSRMIHRKKALQELKAQEAGRMTDKERKAQQAASNAEWQTAFDELLDTADLTPVLTSTAALRLVAQALKIKQKGTHEELVRRILEKAIDHQCRDWDGDWKVDESRTVLQKLEQEEEIILNVSRETGQPVALNQSGVNQ